ncbi:MAG: radical SAM protein [Myxococcales bacterium]|nr:radical SAM protein [Myxococcales bacterium]
MPTPAPPAALDALPFDLAARALASHGLRPSQADAALAALWRAVLVEEQPWATGLAALGRAARSAAAVAVAPPTTLRLAEHALAADGTLRLGLTTADGQAIETVVIPAPGGDRTTVCLSSQAGCAFACRFCETGRLGLQRALGSGEIVAQFRLARAAWQAIRGTRPPVGNVVFMGMGEPFDNLAAVAAALAVLQDDRAFGLGWRSCTVSTVGVVAQLPTFFATCRAHLAVSLNAPDDERRSFAMPVNRRWPLAELKRALQSHLPAGRDVLVEYVLFDGWNDSAADARLLAGWLAGLPARLNLIVANPGPDAALRTPTMAAVEAFRAEMQAAGVRALVRHPHGREVGGACGQLAGRLRGASSTRDAPS